MGGPRTPLYNKQQQQHQRQTLRGATSPWQQRHLSFTPTYGSCCCCYSWDCGTEFSHASLSGGSSSPGGQTACSSRSTSSSRIQSIDGDIHDTDFRAAVVGHLLPISFSAEQHQQQQTEKISAAAPAATATAADAAAAVDPGAQRHGRGRSSAPARQPSRGTLAEPAAPQPLLLRKPGGTSLDVVQVDDRETEQQQAEPRGPAAAAAATCADAPIEEAVAALRLSCRRAPQQQQQTCPRLQLPLMNCLIPGAAERAASAAPAAAAAGGATGPAAVGVTAAGTEPCGAPEVPIPSDLSCCTTLPSSNNSRIGSLVATTVTELQSPRQQLQQQQWLYSGQQLETEAELLRVTHHKQSNQQRDTQQLQHIKDEQQTGVASVASLTRRLSSACQV